MTIDVTVTGGVIQLAIAIATAIAAIAAWGSVFLQRRQQKRDAEQALTNRRYQELVDLFDRAGSMTGEAVGLLHTYAGTGAINRGKALSANGRAAHFAAIMRLHNAPDEVEGTLLEFSKLLNDITQHLPPWWWFLPDQLWLKVRPIPKDRLDALLKQHIAIQDKAREQLQKLTPREDLPV